MFKPDSILLIQIQLALIGIVVVVGLFYLWKIINRLVEKVDKHLDKSNHKMEASASKQVHSRGNIETPTSSASLSNPFMMSAGQYHDENSQEEIANAEELMKHVFGRRITNGRCRYVYVLCKCTRISSTYDATTIYCSI
jgi:ABC-type nickel/cobalt efflux system permease component RcnA